MCKVFIDLKKMKVIEEMYKGTSTRVRNLYGGIKDFTVRVGVHQDSALSSNLFSLIIDETIKDLQDKVQ